jgi:hypothetical protein
MYIKAEAKAVIDFKDQREKDVIKTATKQVFRNRVDIQ